MCVCWALVEFGKLRKGTIRFVMSVRPSVRPSVRLSVRLSVCPSARPSVVCGTLHASCLWYFTRVLFVVLYSVLFVVHYTCPVCGTLHVSCLWYFTRVLFVVLYTCPVCICPVAFFQLLAVNRLFVNRSWIGKRTALGSRRWSERRINTDFYYYYYYYYYYY